MQARHVAVELAGTWRLVAWRRVAQDGTTSYPLGADARGLLIYTRSGRMAVQLAAADRPPLPTADALGGDPQLRANAYSTCLAYVGSYEVREQEVVHRIELSLFPNWSGTEQVRPFTYEHGELVLRTPPVTTANGTIVNELAWAREERE
ncbi:MAG: lipocalin-like domain-containing protein [Solirubrobacteraceae bacterium]